MKRPVPHGIIATFGLVFGLSALIACMNTGDLFVRGFLILAAIAALTAGHAVWHGQRGAAKRVAIWSILTAVLGSAVFIYSRYYALRPGDETIASTAIMTALLVAFAAVYLERRPWSSEEGNA